MLPSALIPVVRAARFHVSTLRSAASLLRWLGPWSAPTSVPAHIEREELAVSTNRSDPGSFRLWIYRPPHRQPVGAYLVLPGLHYLGPSDPRLDRFLRCLADAGFVAACPFLPDYLGFRLRSTVVADASQSLETLIRHRWFPAGHRPGLLSISFGSYPALRLACDPQFAERIGGIILFGGYADLTATMRFSLDAAIAKTDPLDTPVIFVNLIEQMGGVDRPALCRQWIEYMRQTWGRPEMHLSENHARVAETLAAELVAPADRELFLVGCNLLPGAKERFEQALLLSDLRIYDPRPLFEHLRVPVAIIHGQHDDVIPVAQARLLADAMPTQLPVSVYITGLFSHTGSTGIAGLIHGVGHELRSLLGIMRALLTAGGQ